MIYSFSWPAFVVFAFFVAVVLGLSFYLGKRAKSAKGYYAAHGEIHWFVNGIAFAGDYLSAASFLGICGMIAYYGYDGFLYSIGYLAGWIVALFVIAEPIKRLGKFTFADALDAKFNSRGIKLTVAISTLVVSIFYLIPQMVGAGALITPLLGFPHWIGVLLVGLVVTSIVVTAGMVSTTWVQFIKGSLLVVFCLILTVMILNRGLKVTAPSGETYRLDRQYSSTGPAGFDAGIYAAEGKAAKQYVSTYDADRRVILRAPTGEITPETRLAETQHVTTTTTGERLVNGRVSTAQEPLSLHAVGHISSLPGGVTETGPLGPFEFLSTLQDSTIVTVSRDTIKEPDGAVTNVFYPVEKKGSDLLMPGASPTFAGVRSPEVSGKLDFISLMLALFCGTASLPHILIRYYTVKDQAAARKSTVAGIAAIGFFYILTLYLGLGAMTSGVLDPSDAGGNMAAPLLAKSFSNFLFAVISAIAFTTVLGTVSGLIMAGSGAVAHDLLENYFKLPMSDHQKVFAGKMAALVLGVIAMVLGILFKGMNVSFLVGWAFNIAASANLPSLVMLLFWPRTTKQGITAAVTVGMLSSLTWILLSPQVYRDVYGWNTGDSIIPFSQPGLVTIPLGFLTLVVVSLLTPKTNTADVVATANR